MVFGKNSTYLVCSKSGLNYFEGFYIGDGIYKIRFMPKSMGVFEFSETHLTIKIPYNKKVLEVMNTQENIQDKTWKLSNKNLQ